MNAGLMGYNGVLCAIALGDKSWKGFLWASCAVLLSVIFQMVGMNWGIITLTAPFVLAGNGTAKNRGTKKPVCGYGVKRLVPAK